MAKILKKEQLSEQVYRYRLEAPRIARKRKAGQFIIIRATEECERLPLTIAHAEPDEGWIEIIFQVVGKGTMVLAALDEGQECCDLVGPLGKPTHIEKFGKCVCIGGGVGVAPLFPIIEALHEAGNDVTSIIGARNKDLLILQDEISALSDRILIATDDGSTGYHGFAAGVLTDLLQKGEKFDLAVVIGPVIMMKATTAIAVEAGISTVASLNPIMVDGTGMCGGCRVTIGGETKFACVDGPEFDAAKIDWNELINRLGTYRTIESDRQREHSCKLGDVA